MTAIDVLKERLKSNYSDYKAKWFKMSQSELIIRAYEIAEITLIYLELPKLVSEADAVALLKYENPLCVVADMYGMVDLEASSEFEYRFESVLDKIKNLTDSDIKELDYRVA